MNNNFSVNNWLAETKEGNLITIDEVKDIHTDYFCCDCKEILHGRALESELVLPHFYHLQNNNLKSCNCESAYKRYWKDKLIGLGEIIELKFLNEVTCIHKEINYKVNEDITADIYFKTSEGQEILFLFKKYDGNFINLDYDIFYIDIMQLTLSKSNFKDNHYLLHSAAINKLNNKLNKSIDTLISKFKLNLNKTVEGSKIDIKQLTQIQEQLKELNYIEEYENMTNIIKSLQDKQQTIYTYKGNKIYTAEIIALGKLIQALKNVTIYNIDLDLNILKSINYKIYNKGYHKYAWSKLTYFDLIKPLGAEFQNYINEVEKIIN